MSNVVYRKVLNENNPEIVNGTGNWLYERGGKRYLDMSSGPCCFSLGYSNRAVIDEIVKQAEAIPCAFPGFWSSQAAERAADMIALRLDTELPGWFGGAIFLQTGGEAVDLACKLAAQYHLEGDGDPRIKIAARDHSFHGVGALSGALSGLYPRYEMMLPFHQPMRADYVVRIPHPFPLYDTAAALTRTRDHIGREKVAAIIIEPVNGPPMGGRSEDTAYIRGLRQLCDEQGILLIFDEVLCGSGRCGYLTTAAYYGVQPDIIILGKCISAGYQPVSVICMSAEVRRRIEVGSGTVMFGTTYGAHNMGCAAVAATLAYLNLYGLYEGVVEEGDKLQSMLEYDLAELPMVREITGLGYLRGIRLCDPEGSHPKAHFPPAFQFHAVARRCILDAGAAVYSKGQTVFGTMDFLTVAPPFEMTDDELKIGIRAIRDGLNRAYAEYRRSK